MLLDIEAAIFAATDHVPVIKLLDMVVEGRHDWYPTLPDALRADQFVARLNDGELRAPALAEWARKRVEEAANPRPALGASMAVTSADLLHLLEDLSRQAVMVVEDGITDECFLLAIARAFGHDRIARAEARGWLRFAHAGGKSRMDRFVAKERRHFRIVVRVAALLDSDRKVATERGPNHDQVTRIRSVDGVTEVHMWAWCEVENYVPTRVWERHFPNQATKIGTLRKMSPDQRGYLDIKKGLGTTPEPEVASVFAALRPDERREWRTGFKMKSNTPLVPDGLALTEDDFAELGPDAVAELKSLLAMIQRIL